MLTRDQLVVTKLSDHTDAATSTESFRANFKSCRDNYAYGDVKRLVLLMGLLNAYATCESSELANWT